MTWMRFWEVAAMASLGLASVAALVSIVMVFVRPEQRKYGFIGLAMCTLFIGAAMLLRHTEGKPVWSVNIILPFALFIPLAAIIRLADRNRASTRVERVMYPIGMTGYAGLFICMFGMIALKVREADAQHAYIKQHLAPGAVDAVKVRIAGGEVHTGVIQLAIDGKAREYLLTEKDGKHSLVPISGAVDWEKLSVVNEDADKDGLFESYFDVAGPKGSKTRYRLIQENGELRLEQVK